MARYKGSDESFLALSTFVKLVRCTNSVCASVHRHLFGKLTVSQFGILEALYHLGPMAQKELAGKILKSAGNITTIINNLEKNALVVRCVGREDKRICTIQLTDRGRAVIKGIFPVHADLIRERMALLSDSEQRTLGNLLKKLGTAKKI
jgi:MarR family transcriptional regulator, 2-MHQ and catechol-resistance regulon repressor